MTDDEERSALERLTDELEAAIGGFEPLSFLTGVLLASLVWLAALANGRIP